MNLKVLSNYGIAAPYTVLAAAAVVAGGVLAAAVAHAPTQPLVWLASYLVLVVGVAQYLLGKGQAHVAATAPRASVSWSRWLLFNLGNVGVIVGTLWPRFFWLLGGTVLFLVAIIWFGYGVRKGARRVLWYGYLALLALVALSAVVGVVLSLISSA